MSRRTVLAAGGVLWRGDPNQPEIALVHRPRYDDWSLAKGKAKAGEHLLVTAVREIAEETGHQPRVGPFLATVRYRVTTGGRPATKVVSYWAMRSAGGSFEPNREVDELRWLPVRDARRALSSDSDRAVLRAFSRMHVDTDPLLLVRHGETTRVPKTKRAKAFRRLSRTGREQAAALSPVLSSLGVSELLCADLPACVETLAPFATLAGLDVHADEQLTRAGLGAVDPVTASAIRKRASSGQVLAVCAQQGVIARLLPALAVGSALQLPHDRALRKSGWWLLHQRDGAVLAYERHELTG